MCICLYIISFWKLKFYLRNIARDLQSPGDITWPGQWLHILPEARCLDYVGFNFHFSKIVAEEGMGL